MEREGAFLTPTYMQLWRAKTVTVMHLFLFCLRNEHIFIRWEGNTENKLKNELGLYSPDFHCLQNF